MKFLRQTGEAEGSEAPEEIMVLKLIDFTMECMYCDTMSAMKGGPVDSEKAKFLCSNCNKINTIKWGIDI